MFIVRNAQIKVLEGEMRKKFLAGLHRHARENFPAQTKRFSDDDLRDFLSRQTNQGEKLGFVQEREIAKFIEIILLRGRAFEDDRESGPEAKILADPAMSPAEKLRRMKRHVAQKSSGATGDQA